MQHETLQLFDLESFGRALPIGEEFDLDDQKDPCRYHLVLDARGQLNEKFFFMTRRSKRAQPSPELAKQIESGAIDLWRIARGIEVYEVEWWLHEQAVPNKNENIRLNGQPLCVRGPLNPCR